jgi:hypothetical protein
MSSISFDLLKKAISSLGSAASEELRCSICYSHAKVAKITKCNHCFCSACLEEYVKQQFASKKPLCPNCREEISERACMKVPLIDEISQILIGIQNTVNNQNHNNRKNLRGKEQQHVQQNCLKPKEEEEKEIEQGDESGFFQTQKLEENNLSSVSEMERVVVVVENKAATAAAMASPKTTTSFTSSSTKTATTTNTNSKKKNSARKNKNPSPKIGNKNDDEEDEPEELFSAPLFLSTSNNNNNDKNGNKNITSNSENQKLKNQKSSSILLTNVLEPVMNRHQYSMNNKTPYFGYSSLDGDSQPPPPSSFFLHYPNNNNNNQQLLQPNQSNEKSFQLSKSPEGKTTKNEQVFIANENPVDDAPAISPSANSSSGSTFLCATQLLERNRNRGENDEGFSKNENNRPKPFGNVIIFDQTQIVSSTNGCGDHQAEAETNKNKTRNVQEQEDDDEFSVLSSSNISPGKVNNNLDQSSSSAPPSNQTESGRRRERE